MECQDEIRREVLMTLKLATVKVQSNAPHGLRGFAGILTSDKAAARNCIFECLDNWKAIISIERHRGDPNHNAFVKTKGLRGMVAYRNLAILLETELKIYIEQNGTTNDLDPETHLPMTFKTCQLLFAHGGGETKSCENTFMNIRKHL